MTPMPYAPLTPELAAANREARRCQPRRTLRRVVVVDVRRRARRRPC